jgi:hypothetical protein
MPLSPICATGSAHHILLDFITCTILGDEYRPLSSPLSSAEVKERVELYRYTSSGSSWPVIVLTFTSLLVTVVVVVSN